MDPVGWPVVRIGVGPEGSNTGDKSLVHILQNMNRGLLRDQLDALLSVTGSSW
jgi:hypothetical protein